MNIAQIISMPAHGGAEHYVRDLAVAIKRGGHGVSIWFLSAAPNGNGSRAYEEKLLAYLRSRKIDCEVLDGRGWRRLPRAIFRVRRLVKSKQIDLIHAHLFQGILAGVLSQVPIVYTRHGMDLRVPRSVYRWIFDNIVHTYVAISVGQSNMIRAAVRRQVVLIPNGVNMCDFSVSKLHESPNSEVRLVFVGRLVAEKNVSGLLRSLALLPGRDWVLSLAGGGPERPQLEVLARDLGLESNVTFLGPVNDVPGLLAQSDVFVMSSISEGMPIALLEATAAGLPVLVTDVGGCAEVVEQIGHGIVVPPGSESAYASALKRLIDDTELRMRFARRAVSGAAHYSIQQCAAHHLALYREVIEAHSGIDGSQGGA